MLVLSVSKRICNVNAPLRVVMHTLNLFFNEALPVLSGIVFKEKRGIYFCQGGPLRLQL